MAIEIPAGFGRDLRRGRPVEVGAWIDGAMPFRAETTRGYLVGRAAAFHRRSRFGERDDACPPPSAKIETRFRYNQNFESVNAMVPSTIAMLLALIPAILMALGGGAGEGAGIDHESLCHAGDEARVHPGQATALCRHRHDQLPQPGIDGHLRLRSPPQGKLPGPGHRRADLCDRHHRLWTADLRLREARRSPPCSERPS